MPFIVFEERFRLGHPEIDRQHEGLFDAVNRLHDAMAAGQGRAEVGKVLAFLRTYVGTHFETEERFMEETRYPGRRAHRTMHLDFIRKVDELEEARAAGNAALSISLMTFLKEWLTRHIGVEDRRLADHLAGRR